jgi:carbon-monoxide dehydrogenase small subunit
MNLGFILNGEDVVVDSNPEKRLVDILRETFNLTGTRGCCHIGICGNCQIIFNGIVVKSCLIPAFKIRGCEIITIEGFSQTDEYQDIVQGFSEAELEHCGICNTGKVLATEALLGRIQQPSKREILSAFSGIKCRCTEPEELVQGVLAVCEFRQRRHYGRSS